MSCTQVNILTLATNSVNTHVATYMTIILCAYTSTHTTSGLKDPFLVRLDVDSKLSEQLRLCYLSTRQDNKPALLLYLLQQVLPSNEQTVIFAATKHHVEFLREVS